MFVYKSELTSFYLHLDTGLLGHQNDYSGTLAQKCDTYLPKVGVEILILSKVPTIGTLIQKL